MDFSFFLFLCTVAVWLYYPLQWFLEGIGDIKFFERLRIYWEFIRLLNCLFLSASLVSLYQYIFGEWSIFGGWNLVKVSDFTKEAVNQALGVIALIIVLVLPLGNLILSMVVLSLSYKKIKNPKENILFKDSY